MSTIITSRTIITIVTINTMITTITSIPIVASIILTVITLTITIITMITIITIFREDSCSNSQDCAGGRFFCFRSSRKLADGKKMTHCSTLFRV